MAVVVVAVVVADGGGAEAEDLVFDLAHDTGVGEAGGPGGDIRGCGRWDGGVVEGYGCW